MCKECGCGPPPTPLRTWAVRVVDSHVELER